MNREGNDRLMRRAMERAADHDTFVASALALYRSVRGLEEAQVAEFLGCPIDALPRLALCRVPPEGARFRQDIEQIADYTGADASRLAMLLRDAATARALRGASARATDSMLLAARDAGIPPLGGVAEQPKTTTGEDPPAEPEEPPAP